MQDLNRAERRHLPVTHRFVMVHDAVGNWFTVLEKRPRSAYPRWLKRAIKRAERKSVHDYARALKGLS